MVVTISHAAGRRAVITGTWTVVSESGGIVCFRRTAKDSSEDADINFIDANTFTINGPNGGLTYRRRRTQLRARMRHARSPSFVADA